MQVVQRLPTLCSCALPVLVVSTWSSEVLSNFAEEYSTNTNSAKRKGMWPCTSSGTKESNKEDQIESKRWLKDLQQAQEAFESSRISAFLCESPWFSAFELQGLPGSYWVPCNWSGRNPSASCRPCTQKMRMPQHVVTPASPVVLCRPMYRFMMIYVVHNMN